MADGFSITCRLCGKKTEGIRICQIEYNFDIDGWDGHIDFFDHKKEYCIPSEEEDEWAVK